MMSFKAGEGPRTTRSASWQRLARAFFKHVPVPGSESPSGSPSQPASCVMNAEASLEGRAAGLPVAAERTVRGPQTAVAFLPKNLRELLGAFSPAPCPSRRPPPRAHLCHHSLPTGPGGAQRFAGGVAAACAETDDIFISLSKPPLFMEVSPGSTKQSASHWLTERPLLRASAKCLMRHKMMIN